MGNLKIGSDDIDALKFDAPIVVESDVVDPTTIEAFRATLGSELLYNKAKNFQNLLVAYNIAIKSSNSITSYAFVYSLQHPNEFANSREGYQITQTNYQGRYSKFTFPMPTDMASLLTEQYPIKFNFKHTEITNGFWTQLYNILKDIPLTDCYYGNKLFKNSNVKRMKIVLNPTNAVSGANVVSSSIALIDEMFSRSEIENAEIILKTGKRAHSIHELFLGCNKLQTLIMTAEDGVWEIGEWSGSFESCSITSLPEQLRFANTQNKQGNDYLFTHCQINYAFEYSNIAQIGHGEEIVIWEAEQAFNCAPNLTKVNLILDCKYLDTNKLAMFAYWSGQSPITTPSTVTWARIKNINKNDWIFDGIERQGKVVVGNCENFDADSINYILNNCYDLTGNANDLFYIPTTMQAFNQWTYNEYAGGHGYVYAYLNVNGKMSLASPNISYLKIEVSNMTAGDVLVVRHNSNVVLTITQNGNYYYKVTSRDLLEIEYTTAGANPNADGIRINYPINGRYEVTEVTEANIYCPESWRNKIDNAAALVAQSRGWHIYINNQLVNYS